MDYIETGAGSLPKTLLGQNITYDQMQTTFTEAEILRELDLAFGQAPSKYFPKGGPNDIRYNFFLDLEHGYCYTASSRIHLYADDTRWAIVQEKSGYQNRGMSAEIELCYIGNCIDYVVNVYEERNYISNMERIILIEPDEYERIENKDESEGDTFERIGLSVREIKVRDQLVPFDNNYEHYEQLGIQINEEGNPKGLIGFKDLLRYWNTTNPALISAKDTDIRQHLPSDLPKVMILNVFHHESVYADERLPSEQETYQLIAKVLATKDPTHWRPTHAANNHWSNWESGHL